MFLSKLKVLTAGVLAAVALLAVGLSAYPGEASEPRPPARRNAPIPAAKPTEERILVGVNEAGKQRLEVLTPKGEKVATINLDPHPMYHPALSRDGKRAAVWSWNALRTDIANPAPAAGQPISHKGTLLVYDLDKPEKPLATLGDYRSGGVVFAPDGRSLYLNEAPEPGADEIETVAVHRFDLKSGKKTKVELPAGHSVRDITADGKALLTNRFHKDKDEFRSTPYLVPVDTLKAEPLSKSNIGGMRLSPDGSRVVGTRLSKSGAEAKSELVILNVKDGKESVVKLENTDHVWDVAWSRDGKKLLVNRSVLTGEAAPPPPLPPPVAPGGGGGVPMAAPPSKPELTIRNLDGSEPKVLLELKANSNFFGIDWR